MELRQVLHCKENVFTYRFNGALNCRKHKTNKSKIFGIAKCRKLQISEDFFGCLLRCIRGGDIRTHTGTEQSQCSPQPIT